MEDFNFNGLGEQDMQKIVVRAWLSMAKSVLIKFYTTEGEEPEDPITLNEEELEMYVQEAERNEADPEAGLAARQTAMMVMDSMPLLALQMWRTEVITQVGMKAAFTTDPLICKTYGPLFEKLNQIEERIEKYPIIILLCNEAMEGPCFCLRDDSGENEFYVCIGKEDADQALMWPEKPSKFIQLGVFSRKGNNDLSISLQP